MQIDEAYNTWNAYSLLETGQDEWGNRWPIFSARGFDDYRSTMYLYALMPFEAIWGINSCTARLPAAIGGIVTVGLIYLVGRRMFDLPTAITAAAVLTLVPWHILDTRLALEASLGPLLVAASLWMLIWSGAPVIDNPPTARVSRVIVASVTIGISCYGYAAVRLFLPTVLILIVLANARLWWNFMRTRHGLRYGVTMAAVLFVIVGPLVWKHLTDPNLIARAAETKAWSAGDSWAVAAAKILGRIPLHFSIPLLFMPRHQIPAFDPPEGFGFLDWYTLPLMIAGFLTIVLRLRSSASARTLVVLFLCYATGDLAFADTSGIHPLRCFPGILGLCLMIAVGAASYFQKLWTATTG